MHLKAIFEEFENYDFSPIYQKNVKNSNTKKFALGNLILYMKKKKKIFLN
jgi:hypothetical protein